jgi:hypothetical protein
MSQIWPMRKPSGSGKKFPHRNLRSQKNVIQFAWLRSHRLSADFPVCGQFVKRRGNLKRRCDACAIFLVIPLR